MTAATTEPTLDDIAAARAATEAKTPQAVLAAFLPKPVSVLSQKLLPLTAGHELLLSQIGHPLATGEKWEDVDVLMALFIFTHPSRILFEMVAGETLEAEFFAFIDAIPSADIAALGPDMVSHWMASRITALNMESKHAGAQKKTAASVGGSTPSRRLAKSSAGIRKWLSMTFRSLKSSR